MRSRLAMRAALLGATFLATVAVAASDATVGSAAPASAARWHSPRAPAPSPGRIAPSPGTRASVITPGWASRNWSGYAVTGGAPFTSVSGTFTVPTVLRPSKKRQMHKLMLSSDWVGIDGFNNSALIQAGIEEVWTGGRNPGPFYQAWWEILPAPETPIDSGVAVSPGNQITVTITDVAGPLWMITVANDTTGGTFMTEQAYSGPLSSAEWIHEAVTFGRSIATLPHDTDVTFSGATANLSPVAFNTSEAGVMVKKHRIISTPSVPNGNGFTVGYGSVAPPPPLF